MQENKRYRLSLDDNIWFLQDIARKGYDSLFENAYLAFFRTLHAQYGTKIHANLYYECPEHGGFNLSQFPARYRAEWSAHRDWLRLAFHGRANKPDFYYLHAGYDEMYADCALVLREIRRFAGDTGPVATLHFVDTTEAGIRALYDCGVRALMGLFLLTDTGEPSLCYGASRAFFDQVRRYAFARDPKTGMVYFPCDIVLNAYTPQEIPHVLDDMAARYPHRPFIDLLIHEQYFYPDYCDYLPDYRERVLAGVAWCERHGFTPGFAEECEACQRLLSRR
ncbi:MAG: hypothetical protein RR482_00220 [Clostridia bacterium]